MSQTQQKIFADFENTGHLQPSVKELATALRANIAAPILAMITVSPNLLAAEYSELATLGIDLDRPPCCLTMMS
jgi:hypothetical protein